jgi:Tol biopolymer transport system component
MNKKSLILALSFLCATSFLFADGDLSVTEIPGILGWGSISPDGTTIVIAKGEKSDSLVLYDIESGTEKLVLKGRVVQYPRLDPEGKRIIFTGEKPYAGLWTVGTDGKGLKPFPSKQGASDKDWTAIWSPDGTRVAWCRNFLPDASPQLWIANADGSGAKILVKALSGYSGHGYPNDGYIGNPIDWVEDKILTSGNGRRHALYRRRLVG